MTQKFMELALWVAAIVGFCKGWSQGMRERNGR
jgi:hypothetical protein